MNPRGYHRTPPGPDQRVRNDLQGETALREQARQAVRSADAPAADAPGLERLQRHARRTLDEQLARIRRLHAAPACARGCAMCCHLRVMATPAEVFGLARYIRRQLAAGALQELARQVSGTAIRLRGIPRERLLATNVPCPLLVDGACSMYAARPFNCRAYHSLDVDACTASFNNPGDASLTHPQSAMVARVNEGVQQGLADVLGQAGLDRSQYELVTALDEALSDPAAEARFLHGEPAFRSALRA